MRVLLRFLEIRSAHQAVGFISRIRRLRQEIPPRTVAYWPHSWINAHVTATDTWGAVRQAASSFLCATPGQLNRHPSMSGHTHTPPHCAGSRPRTSRSHPSPASLPQPAYGDDVSTWHQNKAGRHPRSPASGHGARQARTHAGAPCWLVDGVETPGSWAVGVRT